MLVECGAILHGNALCLESPKSHEGAGQTACAKEFPGLWHCLSAMKRVAKLLSVSSWSMALEILDCPAVISPLSSPANPSLGLLQCCLLVLAVAAHLSHLVDEKSA